MSRTSPKPVPVRKAKPPYARGWANLWICLALLVSTLAVYAPVARFEFVNFDDPEMIAANAHVRQGVTPAGLNGPSPRPKPRTGSPLHASRTYWTISSSD